MPLASTYFLFRASSNDSEGIAIKALHDDIGFLVAGESLDFEISNEIFVLAEFICNVSEVLDGHFLARADEDDVVFGAEARCREAIVMGQSG